MTTRLAADADEPAQRKSRRGLILVGALAASVLIGGGLGVVYKFMGPSSPVREASAPKKIVAEKDPVKAAPDDPGGKEFADAKKSVYDRLAADENGGADEQQLALSDEAPIEADNAAAASDGASVLSPKKVQTIAVKPGEKIIAEAAAADAPDGDDGSGIPGLVVDGLDDVSATAEAPVKKAAEPVTKAAQKVAAVADEQVADLDSQGLDADVIEAQAAKKLAAKTRSAKVVETEVAEPVASDATASVKPKQKTEKVAKVETTEKVASAGGSGFVVQVAAVESQGEALAKFADLQGKYGDVLGSAQPDIQQAAVSGKTIHRLRLGPAGSKQAAQDLCVQLKALGQDCMVRAQ